MNRIIYIAIFFYTAMFFISVNFCEASESKEDLVAYIKEVASIITNVDITIRGVGFNALSVKEGIKRMNISIGQMELIKYPPNMAKQYKMILLAFKKTRSGLLLFSLEKKNLAVGLIKSGTQLLRYAAKDILAIAEKEGIRKIGNISDQKGE